MLTFGRRGHLNGCSAFSPFLGELVANALLQVMHDVLRSLFETNFMEELFKPQEIYPLTLTRKIFEKLAHSSIMRLSESRCAFLDRYRGTNSLKSQSMSALTS